MLLQEVRRRHPKMPTIALSANIDISDTRTRRLAEQYASMAMPKPLDPDELIRAIEDVTAGT